MSIALVLALSIGVLSVLLDEKRGAGVMRASASTSSPVLHHLHLSSQSPNRHLREGGDPVNAGVAAVIRPYRWHALKLVVIAAAYWIPAFAGMTAESGDDDRVRG